VTEAADPSPMAPRGSARGIDQRTRVVLVAVVLCANAMAQTDSCSYIRCQVTARNSWHRGTRGSDGHI